MPVQDLTHFEDNALTDLISKDYKPAIDELYRRYWERLFLYVVKVIKNRDEAEDILQEVFVSVWIHRQALLQIESVAAYLFSAVRFQGLKYIHNKAKQGIFITSLAMFSPDEDDSLDGQQNVREVELILDKAMEELPSRMQRVFILSRKSPLSHKEIAEAPDISIKTVKKQINNTLKIFRLKLERENLISQHYKYVHN